MGDKAEDMDYLVYGPYIIFSWLRVETKISFIHLMQ
jgi:hypothetical protein